MTRLASTAKAGFYPTPERVTEWIARCIVPSTTSGKILDPCCGEGIAVHYLANAWNLESYGIEIDAERALEAASRLHRVLHLDYVSVRASHHAFQVILLNPPYDFAEGEGKRTEFQFLRDVTKYLQPGGLLVYIVPQYRVDPRMAGFLATSYESIRAYRFPDPEYTQFRQAVIFGVAKKESTRDEPGALALLQQCRAALPVLPENMDDAAKYRVPELIENLNGSGKSYFFRGTEINPNEALAEATADGAWKSAEWQEWLTPKHDLTAFRPLMPLKKGHLAMLIAAGLMQNLRLESGDGTETLLVKGRTYKVQEQVETDDEDEEVVRDRFVTEIVTLDLKNGAHERIVDPSILAQFVEKWRDVLTNKVMETFLPLYQFDLEAEGERVLATLNRLSKHRHVPGRKETGLFPAQRHVAVALWKRLKQANSAICVGEPGIGKCCHPTTRVQINGELLNIEDVWNRYTNADSESSDGEGVWRQPKELLRIPCYDETTGKMKLGSIQRLYRQEIHEPIKTIELSAGSQILVTLSHPFLTPSGWTNEIKPGDFVAVPTKVPWPECPYVEPVPPDFLAWQIAEGYEREKPPSLRIYQDNDAALERLLDQAEFLQEIPGYRSNARIKRYANTCPFLEIDSFAYVQYLARHGYTWARRSAQKVIPNFVMRADVDSIRAFLRAFVDAEGNANRIGIEITSASEWMAHQLVELFRHLGISVAMYPKRGVATNTKLRTLRTYFRITITGNALRLFHDQVGFTLKHKQQRLWRAVSKRINSNLETIYVSDIIQMVRQATQLGRKVSGNLLGGAYLDGSKPTMNRSSALRLLAFINAILSGQLENEYLASVSGMHAMVRRKLARADRSLLAKAGTLLEHRLHQEIRFARVKSVTVAPYIGPVYDLEVEETHNFIANQILVHNTTIATAVSELLRECDGDHRPTIVLCPPHLVPKWVREIQQIVPMAFAMPLNRLSDVSQFFRQLKRLAPGTPAYAVLSREMAKLGSGWRPAYVTRKKYQRVEAGDGVTEIETEIFFACPHCGHPIYEVEGGQEIVLVRNVGYLEDRKRFCFECHEPLYQMIHLNGAKNANGHSKPGNNGNGNGNGNHHGMLIETEIKPMTQRYPIAEFIARRHPGAFKLLLADEVHQMKGQSTDQGYALGSLVRACDKTLALTGTIYGGRATSLFFLLHRLSPSVRSQFKWSDGQKWAERFGILEKVMKRTEGDSGYGTFSGKRRRQTYVRELPGASPELAALLLDCSAFVNLSDLGFQLPGYREYPHEIPMAQDQREAYDALEEQLVHELKERIQQGDRSLLAAYLQSLLAYPNSCFRAEVVEDSKGNFVASAPALVDESNGSKDRLFPKEEWLVKLAKEEQRRGRRVLVFCRQTGTRDITDRLARILGRAGLRADVLKASVGTQVREEWLRHRVGKGMIDVLVTNPRLVETGLDLIDFQTTVFLEVEYSVVRRTTA